MPRQVRGIFVCGTPCRSELARDGRKDTASNQKVHVIVNDHREQARSYKLILWIEIIERLIHRQLAQHDDLRNPQHRAALGAFQQAGEIVGHDIGRGE